MRRHFAVDFVIAALFLSIAGVGGSPAFAEQETTVVAFVEDVSGRVVGFSQGKPTLLGTMGTIDHRTQLDVPPSGELRVCHYQMGKIVTLKGPLRATVSRDGVTLAPGLDLALSRFDRPRRHRDASCVGSPSVMEERSILTWPVSCLALPGRANPSAAA
jgi:hypothetical protein